MRGEDRRTGSLFSYVDLETRVGKDHPLRAIRLLVNEALAALTGEFSALYAPIEDGPEFQRTHRRKFRPSHPRTFPTTPIIPRPYANSEAAASP